MDQPCNQFCEENGKGPCDKAGMEQINSVQKLEALLDLLQIPCEEEVEFPPQTRVEAGAPFVRGIDGEFTNDCYYLDPDPNVQVDCESSVFGDSREPLCLCTEPASTAEESPDPLSTGSSENSNNAVANADAGATGSS